MARTLRRFKLGIPPTGEEDAGVPRPCEDPAQVARDGEEAGAVPPPQAILDEFSKTPGLLGEWFLAQGWGAG